MKSSNEECICRLCGGHYEGFGHNPYPLCAEEDYDSRCCGLCNMSKVIPARLSRIDFHCEEDE